MEKVNGVGGIFFRARDPALPAEWYRRHLGIGLTPAGYEQAPWQQLAGPTVFQPFSEDTAYFGDGAKMWMLNFRVGNLAAMVSQLRGAGIAVELDLQQYPNGVFARLKDPEGNPIELWQPGGPDRASPESEQ